MACKPDIIVNYKNYEPPYKVETAVEELLRYVPARYLAGLEYIELTNSTSSRALRRGKVWSRRRKVRMVRCYGFYNGDHVQVLVDNVVRSTPTWMRQWRMLRTIMIGSVLYHEIGHHIHRNFEPEYREKEDVADRYSKVLLQLFLRKKYRYLWPIRRPYFRALSAYLTFRARA